MTKVLESLVSDNEILKRDNAELQRLLAESREDLHALQEELEEQKAAYPSRGEHALISLCNCKLISTQLLHRFDINIQAVCPRTTSRTS